MMQNFTFEMWMACLREDCRQRRKLLISDTEGLHMLWIRGIEPTLQAILEKTSTVSYLPLSTLIPDSTMQN
jgi:hypothetical protein